MSKEEILDKLLELEKNLTLMFDSDVRVAMALLEEISHHVYLHIVTNTP